MFNEEEAKDFFNLIKWKRSLSMEISSTDTVFEQSDSRTLYSSHSGTNNTNNTNANAKMEDCTKFDSKLMENLLSSDEVISLFKYDKVNSSHKPDIEKIKERAVRNAVRLVNKIVRRQVKHERKVIEQNRNNDVASMIDCLRNKEDVNLFANKTLARSERMALDLFELLKNNIVTGSDTQFLLDSFNSRINSTYEQLLFKALLHAMCSFSGEHWKLNDEFVI